MSSLAEDSTDPRQPERTEQRLSLAARYRTGWLFAIVVSLNLVALAFCTLNLLHFRSTDTQQAEIQSRNLAQAIAQSLGNSIDKIDLSLRTICYEIERQQASGKINYTRMLAVVDQQQQMQQETIGLGTLVTDAAGDVVMVGSKAARPFQSFNIATRDYFLAHSTSPTAGLFVSKPFKLYLSDEWSVVFSQRYNHPDGSFAGIVGIPVSLDYLTKTLARFDVGAMGVISLRDVDLGLIARHPSMRVEGRQLQIGDKNISAQLLAFTQARVAEATYVAEAPHDRVKRIYTFRRLSQVPIHVLVGLAESDYLASWWQAVWMTAVFYVVFTLVTLFVARRDFTAWRRQAHDASEVRESHERLEQALATVQERDTALVAAQEAGGLGTYTVDLSSGRWRGSHQFDLLFGIDADYPHDVPGLHALVHPDEQTEVVNYFQNEVLAKKLIFDREYRIIRHNDGAVRWVHGLGKLDFDAAGAPLRMSGAVQDITERKQAEEQLMLSQEAFMNSSEGIMVTDPQGIILEINPAFMRMSGFSNEEALGQTPRILKSGLHEASYYRQMWRAMQEGGVWEGEFHNRRKDGTFYIQFTRVSAVRNAKGEISRFIALASDVTELRESQHRIEYLAFHDKLTDLPNRTMLADRLQLAIAQADRRHELLGVCYLDLDGFKPINDDWGHDTGDDLLIEVARRLQASVRAGDTVARMGGDEFVVLLGNIRDEIEIEQAVQRMLAAISAPFQIGTTTSTLTMSVGATIYPHDDEDADALIRHADQAMYVAKRTGKNRLHLFDPEIDRRLQAHQALFSRVVKALKHNELCLYYQPKVNMRLGSVVGAEALLRWQHPQEGLLLPADFLHVVENTEFSVTLGEWVLRQALQQLVAWQEEGLNLPVSVNICAYHLQRVNFVSRLTALLAEFPLVKPQMLELEILETTAMSDIDTVSSIITECSALGVSFALDDFGTGYASLTYFRRLPTQLLKIDQSFVMDMLVDPDDHALVGSIIRLAKSFNRQVIAEGVETLEHGVPLMQFGCDLAQGFGIAMPMPAEQMLAWIGNWRVPQVWQNFAEGPPAREGSTSVST